MQQFNASVIISEQLNRLMVNAAQELAQRAVSACAEHYKFDAEEAISLLGLNNVKLERKSAVKDEEVKVKVVIPKPKFPLPYNGEFNDTYCYALRQNNGLYTQCSGVRGNAQFCKSCAKQMQKTGSDMPEYGTIQQRLAVDIFEYVDPNGRKPIAYTKLMKKYKLTQEAVLEEAGKFNITINNEHFIAPEEEETKRGRRKNEDKKEEKPKGAKGRPKKEKKVIQLEGDDDDTDLFAALVEEANNAQEEDVSPKTKKVVDSNEKESAEDEELSEDDKLLIAIEKMDLENKKEQERLEREAKKKAEEEEKAEKAAKKEQERIEREAKKKAEEEEKAAKAAKKEQERIEREAKKKAEEEEKAAKKSSKKEKEVKPANEEQEDDDEDDEEPDIVKKIEHDGKKYLKSKKTGIIYDYTKYIKDGEQIKVGRWNEKTNKIDFQENDEESEEEYDE